MTNPPLTGGKVEFHRCLAAALAKSLDRVRMVERSIRTAIVAEEGADIQALGRANIESSIRLTIRTGWL
jgi:hypothetical protein